MHLWLILKSSGKEANLLKDNKKEIKNLLVYILYYRGNNHVHGT